MTDLPQRSPAPPVDAVPRTDDRRLLETVLAGLGAPDVEACGGELLVHADGRTECLRDPRCSTDPALHVGTVACAEALLGGCCADEVTARRAG